MWGVVGCAQNEEPELELPPRGTYLNATLPPDRSKTSEYDRKEYRSKSFSTKSYKTGKASVEKRFKARSDEFNAAAYQGQNYSEKTSPLGSKVSAYADDTAPTKDFGQGTKVAPTSEFAGAEKAYATERATAEGRRFKSAKIKRRNDMAARAQGKTIRATDVTIAKSAASGAAPGTLGVSQESGRSWVRPRLLSPDDPSPSTTMTSEEVRRILNRGAR
jgi:hypothetical protein